MKREKLLSFCISTRGKKNLFINLLLAKSAFAKATADDTGRLVQNDTKLNRFTISGTVFHFDIEDGKVTQSLSVALHEI